MGVRALWLPDALRMTGYPVYTIPGWETSGRDFRLLEVVVGHHTATSAKAAGDYPSDGVIRNGRPPGLPPRLCNVGLGRSGAWYVYAAGVANHAGVSAFDGFVDLNDEALGIEAESPGDGTWTAEQIDSYPRGVAALLHYLRRPASRYASHRTVARPEGRKPDPVGISDAWMQSQVDPMLANPALIDRNSTQEVDFLSALSDAEQRELLRRVNYLYDAETTGGPDAFPGKGKVRWLAEDLPGLIATAVWFGSTVNRPTDEDPGHKVLALQELADAVTASTAARAELVGITRALHLLAAGEDLDATLDQVRAAVRQELAAGTVKVEVSVAGQTGSATQ